MLQDPLFYENCHQLLSISGILFGDSSISPKFYFGDQGIANLQLGPGKLPPSGEK